MSDRAARIIVSILTCLVCMAAGWMLGQDSTRCVNEYRGEPVCIATYPEGGTHAYNPHEEEP